MSFDKLEALSTAIWKYHYDPLSEELWASAAMQETYKRRSELESLPSIPTYILERADILKPEYEPSDLDILYAEGVTSSSELLLVDFSFRELADDSVPNVLLDSLLGSVKLSCLY